MKETSGVKKYQAVFDIKLMVQFEIEAEDDDQAQEMIDYINNGAADLIDRGVSNEEIDGEFYAKKKVKKA